MNIAILGARGFLGSHLTRHLVLQGHDLTGFVLNPLQEQEEGIKYLTISDLEEGKDVDEFDFDVVINLAARRSTKNNPLSETEVRKYTYSIPKTFIEKTAGPNTKVINTSTYIQNSGGVEGKTTDTYSAAKQELSEFLQEASSANTFSTLDIFLFTIFGPGDRPNHLVPSLLSTARRQEAISLSPGHQLMNLMYVEDVVKNISNSLSMSTEDSYEKYFLWKPEYFSVRDLVSTMEEVTGIEINCLWGDRDYAGHEMFEPWPIPMRQFPDFEESVGLEEGLGRLWELS